MFFVRIFVGGEGREGGGGERERMTEWFDHFAPFFREMTRVIQ